MSKDFRMSELFTTSFESDCETCGVTVYEGEQAGYVDDDFVCTECWEEASRYRNSVYGI